MIRGDGVGLGWTLVRDERGMEIARAHQIFSEKRLSTNLLGDEVVHRVGMKGG